MSVTESPGVVARPLLFDAARGRYYPKPALRGWLHLLWFEASLVLAPLAVIDAQGSTQTTAIAIYTATVSGLFGASALYHRGNWGPATKRWLQRVDHMMIFLLIAGTGTAAFLLAAANAYGWIGLGVLWVFTLAAVITRLVWRNVPEKLAGGIFLGLGWTAGMAVPAVWIHAGFAPALLLVAGGVLYTAGAMCYHRRRPDPAPAVFGYHEVFHTYVCAAAACQYIAITLLLV